jgi:hypothetical protein
VLPLYHQKDQNYIPLCILYYIESLPFWEDVALVVRKGSKNVAISYLSTLVKGNQGDFFGFAFEIRLLEGFTSIS